MTQSVPISLYVHVPWCLKKCPYCDFASIATRQSLPEKTFLKALIQDLNQSVERVSVQKFLSVFFGGGTPSLLSPSIISAFLNVLHRQALIDSHTEITLEANPISDQGTLFEDFAQAGINRFSLGVQSFSDDALTQIKRLHNSQQAKQALERILNTKQKTSIDLMYGLPQQSPEDFLEDLTQACHFGIDHLSIYQLTIEPNTSFGKRPPVLPDDTVIESMENLIESHLGDEGFKRYETSAFARKEQYCQHNLNYWRFGDYMGIGPSAHGKHTVSGNVFREVRSASIQDYLAGQPFIEKHKNLSEKDRLVESIMNAGRLTQGFNLPQLADYAQLPIEAYAPVVHWAMTQDFWRQNGDRIYPTLLGQRFLNTLIIEAIP